MRDCLSELGNVYVTKQQFWIMKHTDDPLTSKSVTCSKDEILIVVDILPYYHDMKIYVLLSSHHGLLRITIEDVISNSGWQDALELQQ
jgi:hypothetical protein